ncbi:hypothetical protein EHW64_06920 [Erwinia psidii]|uniref:hypothetical protein n=1 Tax=Erwinia psidii TaxID=69224 RepID=UPI00226B0B43|nr:hypothetical protein [Erwinia psidii]MCX8960910.1 hypothetical protein [Erwinia psidii]
MIDLLFKLVCCRDKIPTELPVFTTKADWRIAPHITLAKSAAGLCYVKKRQRFIQPGAVGNG